MHVNIAARAPPGRLAAHVCIVPPCATSTSVNLGLPTEAPPASESLVRKSSQQSGIPKGSSGSLPIRTWLGGWRVEKMAPHQSGQPRSWSYLSIPPLTEMIKTSAQSPKQFGSALQTLFARMQSVLFSGTTSAASTSETSDPPKRSTTYGTIV